MEIGTWIKNPMHDVHGPGRYASADHDTRHVTVEEKLWHRSGGDWGIGHAGTDQEAQEIGQSAGLHTGQYHPGRNEYGSQVI